MTIGLKVGTKLTPQDDELYRRVDDVLHYIWDPIGVSGMPMARDEYYSYLPQVFSLVKDGASADRIAAYLFEVVTDRMGLRDTIEHAHEVVAILRDWKDAIDEKYAQ